ncbi:MAG: GntR family transcriptional regulator, partial [Gammaproteobacteria bacterium]|nr:GntR family transcriptional regulator [Gammaproteobacteria bacterium]
MGLSIDRLKDPEVLKDKAYRSLRDAISSLDVYDPEIDLRLDERTLAQQLGVSRTPIRESLIRLENEGFVKTIPHKGGFVVRKT